MEEKKTPTKPVIYYYASSFYNHDPSQCFPISVNHEKTDNKSRLRDIYHESRQWIGKNCQYS